MRGKESGLSGATLLFAKIANSSIPELAGVYKGV